MHEILRSAWWSSWTVGTALGGCLALTSSLMPMWSTVAAMGAVVAAWGRWVFVRSAEDDAPPPLETSATRAVCGAISAVAWLGWTSSDARAGLLYALICVGGPALRKMADVPRTRLDDHQPQASPQVDAGQDALRLVVGAWSFDQLCQARQISQHRTSDPDRWRRAKAIVQREILLDEIERRDRAAFSAWLSSTPPPAMPRDTCLAHPVATRRRPAAEPYDGSGLVCSRARTSAST